MGEVASYSICQHKGEIGKVNPTPSPCIVSCTLWLCFPLKLRISAIQAFLISPALSQGHLALAQSSLAEGNWSFVGDKELNCLEGWEIAEGGSGAASLHFLWQNPNVRMGLKKGLFHQLLELLKATILLHFIAASEGKHKE